MMGEQGFTRIFGLLMAAMLAFTMAAAQPALATTEYIASWKDYEKTLPADQKVTWNTVADAMDILLDAAEEEFQNGDSEAAWEAVNQAYYGYYEITGFERYAMSHIAGSRKTEVENQFSLCKSLAKNGGSQEEFTAAVEGLREMLHTDANKLDGVEETGDSGAMCILAQSWAWCAVSSWLPSFTAWAWATAPSSRRSSRASPH